MKKITLLLIVSLMLSTASFSQYFQATVTNVGNQLILKIKPTATMDTSISYMQFFIAYNTAATTPFTVTNITPNTASFPNLTITPVAATTDATNTYLEFVYNTAPIIAAQTYTVGTEYTVFTATLNGSPTFTPVNLNLISDYNGAATYPFGVVDGNGVVMSSGGGPTLYGTGYTDVSNVENISLANVPTPINFTGFAVSKNGDDAVLNWSVQNEDAATGNYEVERSLDGASFATIATLSPTTNSTGSNNYNYTDANLSLLNSSVVYYRIKENDKDGKFIYSDIQNVKVGGLAINVYPNPVKDIATVTVGLENAASVLLSLSNVNGQQLQGYQLQGTKGPNTQQVDLSGYAAGTYFLKVSDGNDVTTIPLIKQ